jgi:hypothetical protein
MPRLTDSPAAHPVQTEAPAPGPRGYQRVRPPKLPSRTKPDTVAAGFPRPRKPRRRGRLVLVLVVLVLLSGAAGAGWAFKDQLLGRDTPTATAATRTEQGRTADSQSRESSDDSALLPLSALEADLEDSVNAFGEQPVESVECYNHSHVSVGDQLPCRVETESSSVRVSLVVTDIAPIMYDSDLAAADFRAADSRAAEPTHLGPREVARAELNRLRDEDVVLLPLDGSWAVQLASKAEGITDPLQVAENGTNTFYAPDILGEHETFRRDPRFEGDVLLVKGTDFGEKSTYNGKPFWITLLLGDFDSSDDVERWCERQFPELSSDELANSCLPRTLDAPH